MNFADVLKGFAGLLWLVVIGLFVLSVIRASRAQKVAGISTIILVVAVAAVAVTTISAGLVFIQPDERGVVISAVQPKGYREQALQPGLRWIVPYFESVTTYSISKQTYTMSIASREGQVEGDDSITARTLDGQQINVDASVIYAIDPEKVVTVHIAWQKRYSDELIRPLSRGVIRDAVAQYRVEEVVSSKRTVLAQEMTDVLRQKLSENGLTLVDFIIRNITFSPEYAASVEQKQVAEQQAQQAKLVVESRRQEAEQARQLAQGQADAAVINAKGQADARVIQAEAEAKALNLIAQVLADNPDLLTYQYINKLAPGIQVMLVPNDTPYLLPLSNMIGPMQTTTETVPTAVPTPTVVPTPTATP